MYTDLKDTSSATSSPVCFPLHPAGSQTSEGYPLPCLINSSTTITSETGVGVGLLNQSIPATHSSWSSSSSNTVSVVTAQSSTESWNLPSYTFSASQSASNTLDTSDHPLAAPSATVSLPAASLRGAYSASTVARSRGVTTASLDESSVPASSDQGSATTVPERHEASSGPGRAAHIELPLIIGIVGAVLVMVFGVFGIYARRRWRARLAARDHSIGKIPCVVQICIEVDALVKATNARRRSPQATRRANTPL